MQSPLGGAEVAERAERQLVCRVCGAAIARTGAACSIGGAFRHTFFNPAGIVFEIGSFVEAPGCTVSGAPTYEFTWFPGYAWRFAHCRGCGAHLGWQFAGPAGFFGLVLDRLVEGGT